MALMGVDILLYPTAIDTASYGEEFDYSPQWQHVMQGHAVANVIPLCASI
jgi:N-carbamoylputrescine amidase